jgi:hypothetical protein
MAAGRHRLVDARSAAHHGPALPSQWARREKISIVARSGLGEPTRRLRKRGVESPQSKGGSLVELCTPDTSTTAELDRLGDEIAELSAHLDAATARLLDLIREFDARGGWNTGFRSCAAWLS